MELISNKPFDIQSKCGELLLLYLEEDAAAADEVYEQLSVRGYQCRKLELSGNGVWRRNYLRDLEEQMDRCGCLIPVLTDGLFKAENEVIGNLFWYAIGYVRMIAPKGILPYLVSDKGNRFSATPLKNHNLAKEVGELIDTLVTDYSGRLLCSDYYNDHMLNRFASRRIVYRRLSMMFTIRESAFRKLKETLDGYYGTETDEKLDDFIGKNISCGCKIISFGSEQHISPQFTPYLDEIHPDREDVPKAMVGRNMYRALSVAERKEEGNAGIHARFTVDLLIPVHRLFGLYFKIYLKFRKEDCFWVLPLLYTDADVSELTPDEVTDMEYWKNHIGEEEYADEQKERFYFPLGLQSSHQEDAPMPAPEENVGRYMDYMFPQ